MDQDFTTLILFTVVAQTATGAFFFREIILFSSPEGEIFQKFRRTSLAVIVALLLASVSLSFLHLGKPVHAINALNNLKSSWLSREILFMILLTGSLMMYYVFETSGQPGTAKRLISVISMLISGAFIYSMIRLYMLPSVKSWYHPATPVSFIITAIVCGFTVFPALNLTKPNLVYAKLYALLLIIVIFSLVNSGIYYFHSDNRWPVLFLIRVMLPVLAIILIPLLNFRHLLNKYGLWPVILFLLLFTGELMSRIIFFLSFEKSGL